MGGCLPTSRGPSRKPSGARGRNQEPLGRRLFARGNPRRRPGRPQNRNRHLRRKGTFLRPPFSPTKTERSVSPPLTHTHTHTHTQKSECAPARGSLRGVSGTRKKFGVGWPFDLQGCSPARF